MTKEKDQDQESPEKKKPQKGPRAAAKHPAVNHQDSSDNQAINKPDPIKQSTKGKSPRASGSLPKTLGGRASKG